MNISLISSLVKRVMDECGLKQKDLAVVLDVSIDRVKSLTAGKVQKLTPEETRRMVQTLNLSAHWLATGEGPMFNPQGGQKLGEILTQLRLTSAHLASLGLDGDTSSAVLSIVHGVTSDDAHSIKGGLEQAAWAMQSPDERVLLASYRKCNAEGKATLVQTAALLSAGLQSPKRRASPAGVSQDNTGAGAVQIGGNATGAAINTGTGSQTVDKSRNIAKVTGSLGSFAIGSIGRKK